MAAIKFIFPMKYILALDQGTTSSRALVFDQESRVVASAQREFSQIYPRPGWVEHDPVEIWRSQLAVARQALRRAGASAVDLAGIGITNQRETVVLWDRATGQPLHNAIVWQDRRTSADCDRLKARGVESDISARTGLIVDPYFSGTKLAWLLKHVPGAMSRARKGELAFGTVDSWLMWNLTEGRLHATDASNASRTMLFNLKTGDWDDPLLGMLKIPRSVLPEIISSSGVCGETELFGKSVPIAGIAGDQQAALFGQCCHGPGMMKNTYGTGCFLCMHTGSIDSRSENRLLTSVAWRMGGRTEFMMEGSVFVAGAAVQWLRDELGIIRRAADVEALAGRVEDTGGVHFVPAFAGLGAPYWDADARGTLVGLTRGTKRAHIARATLEGIAFQVVDVVRAMARDGGRRQRELRVDGGASANDLLMQFQSDILNLPVVRSRTAETTALGAAYLAGLGVGFWKSKEELSLHWQAGKRFEPGMGASERRRRLAGWSDALNRARSNVQP